MILTNAQLREIWHQKKIPVVFRRGKGQRLMLRLPYSSENRHIVKGGHRNEPVWSDRFRCWETPRSWFNDLIERFLVRFNRVYVIQGFREEQKCAPACWNASGYDCECSCMGANHGTGNPAGCWHVVSETFAVEWSARKYACRLMERRAPEPVPESPVVLRVDLTNPEIIRK